MKTTSLILVVIAMLAVLTVHDVTGRPRGRPDGRGSRLRGPFGGQRPAGQGERPGRNEEGGDHHRVGRPGRQHHRPRACLVKNTTLDIVLCNSTCPQNFVCSEGKRSLEHLEIHVCKPQVRIQKGNFMHYLIIINIMLWLSWRNMVTWLTCNLHSYRPWPTCVYAPPPARPNIVCSTCNFRCMCVRK